MSMTQAMSVLSSSKSNEWYTPAHIIELARQVMGGIGLDPASCQQAQETVLAARWYGPDHALEGCRDGLERMWVVPIDSGGVFLNPPFGARGGKSEAGGWIDKLREQAAAGTIDEAIVLVHTTPGYEWWERLFAEQPTCLLRERLCFTGPDGTSPGPAKRGQTLAYFGPDPRRFYDVFRPHGRILAPVTGEHSLYHPIQLLTR